jgi:phage tail sheath protein FI
VQLSMIAHCERMQDRMAILDPIPELTPQEVKVWREKTTNYDSKFAALYYPWIKVAGPDGRPLSIPPSGHMAGIYARNDNERGVHKAPANEVLRGVLELDTQITKGEQDTLNPIGVNCIRSFTGAGLRVWGARTLSSDPAWRYINVRRLFNYVEKSIEGGTQWIVFEPNDEALWGRVRRDITAFLMGVWRDGALVGSTPDQAFFVKCDAELNPPDVRDRGQLIVDIGLAPVKPAEFVVFRFSQFSGGGA